MFENFYRYTAKTFPPQAKIILKQAGFTQKKQLWYRIHGQDLIQIVSMTTAGFHYVAFSSDPIFADVCGKTALDWFPYGGTLHPAAENFYANIIYSAQHKIPYDTDYIHMYLVDGKDGEEFFKNFTVTLLSEIVLPYLDRCIDVHSNLEIRKELHTWAARAFHFDLPADDPRIYEQYWGSNAFIEMLYLGEYQACLDLMSKNYKLPAPDSRDFETKFRSIPEFYQDLFRAAQARDDAAIEKIIRSCFEQTKLTMNRHMNLGQGWTFKMPGR